jgi:hypothetical protein
METRATSGAFARTFKGGQLDALFEVAAAAGAETIAGEARKLAERLEQGAFMWPASANSSAERATC